MDWINTQRLTNQRSDDVIVPTVQRVTSAVPQDHHQDQHRAHTPDRLGGLGPAHVPYHYHGHDPGLLPGPDHFQDLSHHVLLNQDHPFAQLSQSLIQDEWTLVGNVTRKDLQTDLVKEIGPENDQTEAEKPTGTVRGTKEKNPESENHVNKETPAKHVMTDQERETEREKEETGTKQKRGNEIELETGRNLRKVIEEVEAEIDHLTDGKVGSHDILKIAPLSALWLVLPKVRVRHLAPHLTQKRPVLS